MPTAWTCSSVTATTTECNVTATTTGEYIGLAWQEQLLLGGVVIFFLSLTLWTRLFRPVKTFYEK